MSKSTIQHHDLIGQPINPNDIVAVAKHNDLKLCRVIKVTNKMVKIIPLGFKATSIYNTGEFFKYSCDMIVINDNPMLTVHLLKLNT